MKLPGKGFWVGLVLGLGIAGGTGVFFMNQLMRGMLSLDALSAPARVTHLNGLRVRLEAGELERADQYHRVISWSYRQEGQFARCMAESRWALSARWLRGSAAMDRCSEQFEAKVPDDYDIPGLDKARTDLARRMTARETSAESED